MPPKPPIRLPTKPRTTSIPQVKPALPTRPAKPFARGAPPPPPPHSPSKRGAPPPQWLDKRALGSPARYWINWGINGISMAAFLLFIRDYFVEVQAVRGTSMSPTLNPHAHETGVEESVIIRRYIHWTKPGGKEAVEKDSKWSLQRGDIVTFWKPHKPGEMGIKRVVAVEGDVVYPRRGYAVDPGVRVGRLEGLPDGLVDEDADSVAGRDSEVVGKVVVPYGHVWLEGDNCRSSLDSNYFGPVSRGLIQGKAVKAWSGWFEFRDIGDARTEADRMIASRVVEGKCEIPAVFLE